MKPLEILRSRNLLDKRGASVSAISRLSLAKIRDLAEDLQNSIRSAPPPSKRCTFAHTASFGLGGGASECRAPKCRISRIQKLARFALLYSDRAYIASFFGGYERLSCRGDISRARERLRDDISVLAEVRTLIDHGYIELYAPDDRLCFACQVKRLLGDRAARRFKGQYRKLKEQYLDHMTVACRKCSDEWVFSCNGPSPFFDHGFFVPHHTIPQPLESRPRIRIAAERGPVPLSKSLVRDLGLHSTFAHRTASNAMLGAVTSSCLHTRFVTESELDIRFLNMLQQTQEIRDKNSIAFEHLTSIVPYVADVAIPDLVRLRAREAEAFIGYRCALREAIDQFSRPGHAFTVANARDLHRDIIAPKLAELDRKVKRSKRDLVKKPIRSAVSLVGAISFGMLTGLIPSDLSGIAAALGVAKFGSDLIKDVMAAGDKEDSIRNDQFYFLWKVREQARKKQRVGQ